MRAYKVILFIAFLLCSMQNVFADEASEPDSVLHISLLTSAPGPDIHEAYGHTAIRARISGTDYDWAFNYGVFTYEESFFIWHFILGQAEFRCCAFPTDLYLEVYANEGRWVDEQEINLTEEEKYELLRMLETNALEKDSYQYNFLYSNCTTRAYEKIIEAVLGNVKLPEDNNTKSFRNMLHEYAGSNEWSGFAADLVMGNEVDQTPTIRQMMFLPIYAETIMDKISIQNIDGSSRNLVKSKVRHEPNVKGSRSVVPFRPMHFVVILLIFSITLTVYERIKKRYFKWFDVSLMILQGLTGVLVMILFNFSHHPAVNSNWNVLWLNILPLIALPFMFTKKKNGVRQVLFATIVVLLLTFFVIGAFGVQEIPLAAYLLALTLLIRYTNIFYIIHRSQKVVHIQTDDNHHRNNKNKKNKH